MLKLCRICALRYSNVNDFVVYAQDEPLADDSPLHQFHSSTQCHACLGVFTLLNEMRHETVNSLAPLKGIKPNAQILISLPSILVLLEHVTLYQVL